MYTYILILFSWRKEGSRGRTRNHSKKFKTPIKLGKSNMIQSSRRLTLQG